AGLAVAVNPNALPPGKYSAAVRLTVPANSSQAPIDVSVTLNVSAANPQLVPLPTSLRFAARAVAPAAQDQMIVLTNPGGGGALNFSASVVGKSSWITTITPANGRIAVNSPSAIRVFVSTQGQKIGL